MFASSNPLGRSSVWVLIAVVGFTSVLTLSTGRGESSPSPPPQPQIPHQLPQFGNGYVATFVNRTVEYVGGVFNGAKTKSTRGGLPASTLLFPSCILPLVQNAGPFSYPFDLSREDGLVSINASCDLSTTTTTSTSTSATTPVHVRQRWYAHRIHRSIAVTEVLVRAAEGASTNPSVTLPLVDLTPTFSVSEFPQIRMVFQSTQVIRPLATSAPVKVLNYVYETLVPEVAKGLNTTLVAVSLVAVPSEVDVALFGGSEVMAFRRLSSRVTSHELSTRDPAEMVLTTVADLQAALQIPEGRFYQEHVEAWHDLWRNGVETDSPSGTPPIRSSYYAILTSVRADYPWSTSPGGLSTDGYNGHSFWDEDTWVMPNLMLFHPEIARGSGLQYRLNRLVGAKVNAASTLRGRGAAFPWESAQTGENVCPAPLFAHTEIHITADVVNSIALYYNLTQDTAFLQQAWPVLNETAQFWANRTTALATPSVGDPVYLDNVTGPDEYHLGNNSGFTNYAVQKAIRFTVEAAATLGIPSQSIPNYGAMLRMATNMLVPYDAVLNYHPEYSGYNGSAVKQADTILLNYPLQMPMQDSTRKNDLRFYEKRTSPNKSGASTMTWSMFSVGYLSIADVASGLSYFYTGFVNNCFPPYYQWYQEMGGLAGNDNFVTGGGGFLQNVWAGLAAMRVVSAGVIQLEPAKAALLADSTFVAANGVHLLRKYVFNVRYQLYTPSSPTTSAIQLLVTPTQLPPSSGNGTQRLCAAIVATATGSLLNVTAFEAEGQVLSLNATALSGMTLILSERCD